jgi:hypothetical protein
MLRRGLLELEMDLTKTLMHITNIRLVEFGWLAMLLIGSCVGDYHREDYHTLRKQITPSGKFVIYDYVRSGPAFGSDFSGTNVLEIGDRFSERKGERIDGTISEWLSDDTLLVFSSKSVRSQPKDTFPETIKYSKAGDFVVKTVYYTFNSSYRSISDFDSVATTRDSIFIRLVENDKQHPIIKFPLGATTIKTKADTITHVEVSGRLNKNMNFVYKNKDGSFTTGLPEVGTTWYDLTPTRKISVAGLSKKKIFWEEQ